MKPTKFRSFSTVLALLAPGGLQAQPIRTWDGAAGTSNLLDAFNWSYDTSPAAGVTARWDGTAAGDLILIFNAALGGATGFLTHLTDEQSGSLNLIINTGTTRNIRLAVERYASPTKNP